MIATTLAILLTTAAAPDERAERKARFASCVPKSHNEALLCLDRVLTLAERQRVLQTEFAQVHQRFNNEDLLVAMHEGWLLDDWDSSLRQDLHRAGAPDPLHERGYDAADLMLESYWLWRNHCDLDLRRRTANARSVVRVKRAERRDLETEGVINVVRDAPLPAYQPNCPTKRAAR